LFLVFLVASLIGITKISTNVYLLDDIGKEDPIRKNMNSYSELFSGIRIFEMSVKPLQGISLQDPELIYQLEKVELYLCREFGISECMWVGKALKIENYVDHFQNIKYHKLPPKELIPQYIANLKSGAPEYYSGFVDEGGNQLRISARIGDLGSDRMARFEKSLEQYIRKTCPDPKFTWKLTGTSKLYEQNNKNLATGLLLGLAGSTLIMALALATLFRSPAMILIALIPNIIPLLFLGGIMGFAGITLKASSSIIFSISFGIALNDTIHFLSRFKLEMAQTKSLDIALKNTLFETGQAMILTTLTLLAGFCLLLFSDFGGTRYIGLFSAITLLLAALCDMFLLPLLISDLTFRSKKRAS
jgi:predicted RND superfamily exporter protein